MSYVNVYALDEAGKDVLQGKIILEGEKEFKADPPDSQLLQNILSTPAKKPNIRGEWETVTLKDGENFLNALSGFYDGAYLQCSRMLVDPGESKTVTETEKTSGGQNTSIPTPPNLPTTPVNPAAPTKMTEAILQEVKDAVQAKSFEEAEMDRKALEKLTEVLAEQGKMMAKIGEFLAKPPVIKLEPKIEVKLPDAKKPKSYEIKRNRKGEISGIDVKEATEPDDFERSITETKEEED